ncbi:MAG: hypothetical protein HOO93_17690 [Methyloglobulus sp.]|nr:hypothetical protein [Methyloglobulus sp.]
MKLENFIIAEDIRFENGNKISIMGVVNDEVGITLPDDVDWPIPYRFGVFIRFTIEKADPVPMRFVLTVNHNNKPIAIMDSGFEQKDAFDIISLPLVINPFPLPGYGTIRFNIDIYNNETVLISESKEIKLHPLKQ